MLQESSMGLGIQEFPAFTLPSEHLGPHPQAKPSQSSGANDGPLRDERHMRFVATAAGATA